MNLKDRESQVKAPKVDLQQLLHCFFFWCSPMIVVALGLAFFCITYSRCVHPWRRNCRFVDTHRRRALKEFLLGSTRSVGGGKS